MHIEFSNPETAKEFELLLEVDRDIWVPSCEQDGRCYDGRYSSMTPGAARKYIELKGLYVVRKQATEPAGTVEAADENIS
jgi:hypothetical protein